MADIMEIVAEPLFETRITAPSVNLGVSREAASNGVPQMVIRVFVRKLAGELGALRPRPHKTHITPEHVPELRKLIQARTAEVITNARASRITRHRPNRSKVAFRLFAHRSEFDHGELPAFETDPCLTVKDGAPIGQPDS